MHQPLQHSLEKLLEQFKVAVVSFEAGLTNNRRTVSKIRDELKEALQTAILVDNGAGFAATLNEVAVRVYKDWEALAVRANQAAVKKQKSTGSFYQRHLEKRIQEKDAQYFRENFLSSIGRDRALVRGAIAPTEQEMQAQAEEAVARGLQEEQERSRALDETRARVEALEEKDRRHQDELQLINLRQQQDEELRRVQLVNRDRTVAHAAAQKRRTAIRNVGIGVAVAALVFLMLAAALIILPLVGIAIPFVPQVVPFIVGGVLGGGGSIMLAAGLARFFTAPKVEPLELVEERPFVHPHHREEDDFEDHLDRDQMEPDDGMEARALPGARLEDEPVRVRRPSLCSQHGGGDGEGAE